MVALGASKICPNFEVHYSYLERLEDILRHADLGIEEQRKLEDRVFRLGRISMKMSSYRAALERGSIT
jgi:hypothetical protein